MTASVDTSFVTEQARAKLLKILDNVPGKKDIVLQKSLAGPIDLLVKFPVLKDHGVDRVYFLENDNVSSELRSVIFIANGEKGKHAQQISAQIKRLQQQSNASHDFTVIWVPRRTLVSDKMLESAGVLGDIRSIELPFFSVSLERDLISMELEDSFQELYLRKDTTCIHLATKFLMEFQQKHGLFPRIFGKGDNAERLAELLIRMRQELAASDSSSSEFGTRKELFPSSTVEHLIIIDRDVDMATPLLTQLTYEGLVDEVFGVNHGQIEVNASMVGGATQQSGSNVASNEPSSAAKRKVRVDSNDKLYDQLRDTNFAIVGGLLNKFARRLQNDYDAGHENKSLAELKDFVGKLPTYQAEHQSLKIHTGLLDEIMKHTRADVFGQILEVQQYAITGTDASTLQEKVEDLIGRVSPLPTILRLLCLQSCVGAGLRPKELDVLRRDVVHQYGFEQLLTLDALDKMKLLNLRTGGAFPVPGMSSVAAGSSALRTNYSAVRKPLRLIVEDVSVVEPKDIAYTFSGYAPLSVRIVQCILQKHEIASQSNATIVGDSSSGWRGFEDVLKNVKGPTFEKVQTSDDKSLRARQVLNGTGGEKTSVIFFLGGITFAEIAALRFIAQQEAGKRKIIICTTSIISGNKMMQAAIDLSKVAAA